MMIDDGSGPVQLVPTRPEVEIAGELKARFEEALRPLCSIMDEALIAHGLQIQIDGIAFHGPPVMKHRVLNVRVVRVY
jgi:hypothetical protein